MRKTPNLLAEVAPGYKFAIANSISSPNMQTFLGVCNVVNETNSLPFYWSGFCRRLWPAHRHPDTRNSARWFNGRHHLWGCLYVVAWIEMGAHVTFNCRGLFRVGGRKSQNALVQLHARGQHGKLKVMKTRNDSILRYRSLYKQSWLLAWFP